MNGISRRRKADLRCPGHVDLFRDEPDFFALLGTSHGSGPSRMLCSYPGIFGRKVIEKIRLYWEKDDTRGRGKHLCFFLRKVN